MLVAPPHGWMLTVFQAPCAQSALSQNVQNQISSCGEGVTELQSCVCTKGNNYADISTAISSSLSYSCDSTATEDFTSANVVYSAYCTPDKTFDLPTPTANIVSEMITDMPLFSSLAPCAQSGLSIAVGRMVRANALSSPFRGFP